MAPTTVPWNQVNSGAMSSFPPFISNGFTAAKDFLRDQYNRYPDWFANTGPLDPLASLKRGIWDALLGPSAIAPVPATPPPWDGTTCACVQYVVAIRNGPPGTAGTTGNTNPLTGPVYGLETENTGTNGKNVFIRHGVCTSGVWSGTTRLQIFNGPRDYIVTIASTTRVGTGTTCPVPRPTPFPTPTAPNADDQVRKAPIVIAPNVSISVPVVLVRPTVNVDIDPSIEVAVGPVNFNFNLGGVTFDINPTYAPNIFSPTVNLPSLPPGTTRPPQLPPSGGSCPDPCPDPIVMEAATVDRVVCALESGKYEPDIETSNVNVLKGEKAAWELLFKQFTELNSRLCKTKNNPNVGLSLIGSGVTTYTTRTQFFAVGDDVVSVIVRITAIAKNVTLYVISTPGEEQGKFGNISLCVEGVSGKLSQWGDPGWLWSRDTWYGLPKTDLTPRSLRLTLQAGLSFEVYDTGERI